MSAPLALPDPLALAATLAPERPAIVHGGVALSYRACEAAATRVAAALRARGLGPGDPVALVARNGAAAVVAVHAVRRARAVLVPLHPRHTPDELAAVLRDARARLLLHDDACAGAARTAARRVGALEVVHLGELDDVPEAVEPAPPVALDETQGIVYTSGTSARPKGVVLTHASHWWSAAASALRLGTREDDVWLLALPIAHVGGLAILHRAALSAVPVVALDAFDPAAANAAIDDQRVTLVSLVADALRRLLEDRGGRPLPPTLRRVLLGGGPAPRALIEECRGQGIPVALTYGLTEAASQVATQAPGAAPGASCGPPLAATEIRIDTGRAAARAGEEGEILVRGPTVMARYHARPEETARALAGGWLRTGDAGALDERGELHVRGRLDALIVSGGENVSPAEVEEVLLAHEDVADAVVSGEPHERWGQAPVARVALRPGARATADALAAHCRVRLAPFKVPARILIVERIPRGPTGKVLRRAAGSGGQA